MLIIIVFSAFDGDVQIKLLLDHSKECILLYT